MWFLPFCLVLVFNVQWITCKCQFAQYNAEYPPVFTQQFDATEMVLKPLRRPLDISEGASLTAYCDSNFSTPIFKRAEYGSEPSEGISSVEIKCSGGRLKYSSHDYEMIDVGGSGELTCYGNQPALYLTGYNSHCPHDGKSLQYGLTVANRPILLASLCYDYKTEGIIYINYKSSEMSAQLDDMGEGRFSPMQPGLRTAANFVASNENRTNEINSYFRNFSGPLSNINPFRFDHLVPIDLLTKSFPHQIDVIEGVNSIAWWVNLKEGNWKLFEQLLQREITVRDFEISTGVASFQDMQDVARSAEDERIRELEAAAAARRRVDDENRENRRREYEAELQRRAELDAATKPEPSHDGGNNREPFFPVRPYSMTHRQWNRTRSRPVRSLSASSGYTDAVKYMSGSIVRDVPFYVWTYVKAANESDSTVVFAVNSPFLEASRFNYLDFCKETAFPYWLQSLQYTAKMPSLGYMFACRPHVILRYLRINGHIEEP